MIRLMPHLHRFHVPPGTPGDRPVCLSPEEAHHAARVVRVREGDTVALFDGGGREILGTVVTCSKQEVVVSPQSERQETAPTPALTLALAWLHRDKPVEFAIRHGCALGVTRFVFYRAVRSERPPKVQEKWTRLAVESCKQCGRLWLPTFEVAAAMEDVLAEAGGAALVATADREATPWSAVANAETLTLVIGPEGDFSTEELDAAEAAGARFVSLGATVYRAEVAAVVGCTVIAHAFGQLGPR